MEKKKTASQIEQELNDILLAICDMGLHIDNTYGISHMTCRIFAGLSFPMMDLQ